MTHVHSTLKTILLRVTIPLSDDEFHMLIVPGATPVFNNSAALTIIMVEFGVI